MIKRIAVVLPVFAILLASMSGGLTMSSCDKSVKDSVDSVAEVPQTDDVPMKELVLSEGSFHHTYLVADQNDECHIYKDKVDKKQCFIVVSKKEYRLYVYECQGTDTILAASFPVCYAINPEAKEGEGDNKTPECTMQNPFKISELKDATTWVFDFGDGRGPVVAFGAWFLRLDLTESFPENPALAKNRSIGIHGSTNNVESVPGRDSHGCIRLRDNDLVTLHDVYADLGTKVIVKGIHDGKLPFETRAEKTLDKAYKAPQPGNPVLSRQSATRPGGGQTRPSDESETSRGGMTHASDSK